MTGFLVNPYRFATGTGDPYWANVVLLMHMDGADGSTTFTDVKSHAITANGNAQIDTAQSQYGGASALFDGTGDYLSGSYSTDFAMGSGDFTIELFYRPNSTSTDQALIAFTDATTSSSQWFVQHLGAALTGKVRCSVIDTSATQINSDSTTALSASTWYHIAFVRTAGYLDCYLNGVREGHTAISNAARLLGSEVLVLGAKPYSSQRYTNGWIDEVRVTKGIARYTANFTPPGAAFPDS